MQRLSLLEWKPLLFALASALLVLSLSLGPQAQADDLPFPTVPSPTPPSVPTPTWEATPRSPAEEPPASGTLRLRKQVTPPDVLPGEEIQFNLWLTNTTESAITGIVVVDRLDPFLYLLEVRATRGAAQVQGQSIFVHVGVLEAGQTDVVIIRARIVLEASNGQIILNQASAHFDGGQVDSNIVAAGLPPLELPATGQGQGDP